MQSIFLILLGVFSANIAVADTQALCKKIKDGNSIPRLVESKEILNRKLWKQIDVLASFPYGDCKGYVDQDLFEIDGVKYWRFATREDACDGGNTYGAIYSEDLKTPIAHIYDSDIQCEWEKKNNELVAEYHRCDLKAEDFSVKKLKELGIHFEPQSSSVELRGFYTYSYIHVNGVVKSHQDKEMSVKVLMNIDRCDIASASISYFPLTD